MNGSVLRKTQESLGKVIKKPQLTEKLLSKPPFRFLHDVFTEVIRTTGFMKGLYSEAEMKSENVKEKEAKMAFLQKAIDVVSLVNGESLSVKPARIVAGHEPERTNELLQAIARCCLNKMSSDDAVRRVLSGEKPDPKSKASSSSSRSQNKENREEPEAAHDREEKSKRPKAEESRERQRSGESDQCQRDREQRDRDREKSKEKGRSSDRDRDRYEQRDRDRETREKERDRERDRDRPRDKDREKENHREKDRERRRRDKDQDRTRSKPREEDSKTQAKTADPPQDTSPEEPPKPVTESSARIPRPSSAKGQRRRAKVGSQEAEVGQKPAPPENSTETAPAPVNDAAPSRRTVRPSSARPAPPRVKKQESHAESPAERLSSARTTAVILDGRRTEEEENDEDEQFLVQEAVPAAAAEAQDSHTVTAEAEAEDKHGGLVKKILETKKYYEVSPSSPKAQSVVSGEAQRKERDLVHREIERLRSSVQTVCRSALPLGKIMDYIQEDMDSMQNELQQWRQENRQHAQALTQEHRATELAVQPLKLELAELEELIQDQQARICAVRSTILRNEEKIQRMVTGIHSSQKT